METVLRSNETSGIVGNLPLQDGRHSGAQQGQVQPGHTTAAGARGVTERPPTGDGVAAGSS